MKNLLPKLILCFGLLVLCNYAEAATYYFSQSMGDDSRSSAQAQNPSTPWKSIDKLNAVFKTLQPGDVVLFRRGEAYYGSIKMSKSGAQGRPITLGAYGSGEKPIITSLVAAEKWANVGNGVFEAYSPSFGSSLNIVLLNDKIQEMGRFPNSDAPYDGYLTIESTNGSTSISNNKLSSLSNLKGGEVVIRKSYFTIDRHPIQSHAGNTLVYEKVSGTYNPNKGFGFFVQGHVKTLDKLGEWYYNPSTKKLSVYFGSNQPSSYKVQASTFDYLVTNDQNVGHIVFDNLHFKGANKNAFFLVRSQNVHIKNVTIDFSGEDALYARDLPYLTIENSTASYSSNSGFNVLQNTPNAKISNNRITNTNVFPGLGKSGIGSGYGIEVASDNSLVEYNEVINTGYLGIRFGGNHTVVKNNYVDTFCLLKDDGAGIYTWTGVTNTNFTGRKIIGNIILNGKGAKNGTPLQMTSSQPQAEGIYLDDNSSGVEISGNTVGNISGKGILLHNARNFVVKNNTFFNNNIQFNMIHDNLGNPIRDAQVTDNIFFAKSKDQLTSSLLSIKNDIKEMGSFDRNIYLRPVDDVETIFTQNNDNSGKRVSKYYNLKAWKDQFGKDPSSKTSPLTIPSHKIISIDKVNKLPNGTYDTQKMSTAGVHGSNSDLSWSTNQLDGGALQIKAKGASSVTMSVGAVKAATYVLRVSAKASSEAIVKAFLLQSNTPYSDVTSKITFVFNASRNEYEGILDVKDPQSAASLRFETQQSLTFWLDNVSLQEAKTTLSKPEDYIKFEYNATKNKKSVALDGTYVDARNKPYSGSITLDPFSSIVLIKTSAVSTPVEEPKLAPEVKITSPTVNQVFQGPSNIEIRADIKDNGSKITKVEFFDGSKLLATVNSSPYVHKVSLATGGKYSVTAKAYNDRGQSATSGAVTFSVQEPKKENIDTVVPEKPSVPSVPETYGYSLYLNAGTGEDLTVDGKVFKGDKNFKDYFNTSYENSNKAASSEALYQTERNAPTLKYAIPVPNGTYTVKTYHNELWWGRDGHAGGAGRRVFDIVLEGKLVKDNFDLYQASGNKQTILTFNNIEVKDGKLNLDLLASKDRASISAIVITGQSVETPKEPVPALPEVPKSPSVPSVPETSGYSLYLNAGTAENLTVDGKVFKGDKNFKDYFNTSYENSNKAASSEAIYQTERNAPTLKYAIPVPNGTYTVKTYHNELWWGRDGHAGGAGRRVFDIVLEGKLVKDNFDLYQASGNKQIILTFNNIEVKDGKLNLDLLASKDRASISAIVITGTTKEAVPALPKAPSVPESSGYSLYLNTGSGDNLSFAGKLFKGDKNYKDYFNTSNENNNKAASSEAIYQTERNASTLKYTIPVPNGTYTIKTYHNELWWGKQGGSAQKGRRVFDIRIEGLLVKDDFDIFVANKNQQTELIFENVVVKDGKLNLDMVASKDRASISAIAIIASSSTSAARLQVTPSEPSSADKSEDIAMDESELEVKVYPNPARETTNISINQEVAVTSVLIHSMNGQLMHQFDPSLLLGEKGIYKLPLGDLPTGIYLVSVVGQTEILNRTRLIVN